MASSRVQDGEDQSALPSYIDVFWLFAVAAALLIPLALLLLRRIELARGSVHAAA